MANFTEVELGKTKIQFIDGDRSSRYPKRDEFVEEGIMFLNAESINSGSINKAVANYISEEKFSEIKKGRIKRGDLLLTTRGNGVGNVAYVNTNELGLINAQMLILRTNEQEISSKFLFYYFSSTTLYSYIQNFASGSAQPQIPIRDLKKIPVFLPSLKIQEKIAVILSAYDDLIENNKKRIQILENMAEELYKEWFVRFRFPNYENTELEKGVPKDWTYVNLLELADITYGYAFDSTKFNTERIGRKIIRIRNIPISRSSDYTDEVPHDKYLIQTGDLLVGMDGDFHMNRWFDEESYLVQRSCRIKSKLNIHSAYIRQAIKAPIHFFQSTILGATVGHLGAKHLNSIEILMPSSNHENLFSELNRLDKLSLNLELQNRKLEVMRDNLLPRLISGKLSVENLDIQFPPSMQEQ